MTVKTATTMEALLIWAIQRQRADVGCTSRARSTPEEYLPDVAACGVAAVARQQVLGTSIDCAGSVALDLGNWLDPDAEAVYQAVMALDWPMNLIVCDHARGGTRPDWRPDLKPIEVDTDWVRRRGVMVGKQYRISQNGGPQRDYCRVYYLDRRPEMAAARQNYRDWWRVLAALRDRLEAEGLAGWTITDVGAPAAPWEKNS